MAVPVGVNRIWCWLSSIILCFSGPHTVKGAAGDDTKLSAADDDVELSAAVVADLKKLWDMVVVGKASRGVPMEDVPDVRRVCQFGLGGATVEVSRFVLSQVQPPVLEIEFHDVESKEVLSLVDDLAHSFDGRVVRRRAAEGASTLVAHPRESPCDLAIVSKHSPKFTIERLLELAEGNRYIAVVWISIGCITVDAKPSTHSCGFLNIMWDKTLLMRRGYCIGNVCLSRVPVHELKDPNVFELDCDGLVGTKGHNASLDWESPAAEFSQDWYVFFNFFRQQRASAIEDGGGFYVDVGACLPFEYSNTVIFDRCLGWKGLCIEANPGLIPWLEAYRSCDVINNCVLEASSEKHQFVGRDGGLAFTADCLPLGEILSRAGLRGRRIDILSIDVEHGELEVLKGLNFDEFDIRYMIIEVGRGARWLEVETEVLPRGYAKIAVLGRDVVYAKLTELSDFTSTATPSTWSGPYPGTFLPVHAADDDKERSVDAAKARCKELGQRCGGITCAPGVDSGCTVRAARELYKSPSGEVSHIQVPGFSEDTAEEQPNVFRTGSALLPSDWAEFHDKVLTDELRQERSHERELMEKGLRRPAPEIFEDDS